MKDFSTDMEKEESFAKTINSYVQMQSKVGKGVSFLLQSTFVILHAEHWGKKKEIRISLFANIFHI